MDLKIEFYEASFIQQGNDFDFPVFMGTSRYQSGQGIGNVFTT